MGNEVEVDHKQPSPLSPDNLAKKQDHRSPRSLQEASKEVPQRPDIFKGGDFGDICLQLATILRR